MKKTFVYQDLGFPILLIDCPLKKRHGEWTIDINLSIFQAMIFDFVREKGPPWSKEELIFMKKYADEK